MEARVAIFLLSILILVFPRVMAQPTTLREPKFAQSAPRVPASEKTGEIIIEPASLTTPDGEIINFELGTLYVPENRSDPNARIIGVGVCSLSAAASYWGSSNLSP